MCSSWVSFVFYCLFVCLNENNIDIKRVEYSFWIIDAEKISYYNKDYFEVT
jgi:hypothetical protein